MDINRRAELARQLLSNPVFSEAFNMLKIAYIDRMISTKPEDVATRDHFHKSILALSDVKSALTACVEKGKIEKVKAARAEKVSKGKRN